MDVNYFKKGFDKRDYRYFVLGADVGGTNTSIGIAGVKSNRPILLFSMNFKTKELDSIILALEHVLHFAKEKYDIKVKSMCIGGAGPVKNSEFCELTNASWSIDAKEIEKRIGIRPLIVNDFQLVGYGMNLLDDKQVFQAISAKPETNKPMIVLGAGTGLGKSILIKKDNQYIPMPSEGGHADFPIHDGFDLLLTDYVRKEKKVKQVSYEDILSGKGLVYIFEFVKKHSKTTKMIDKSDNKAELISKYRKKDPSCKQAFDYFTRYIARCAKNLALDSLAGKVYIAGGIAAKNKGLFRSKTFREEFFNCHEKSSLLKKIPVEIITDYNISLQGACFAAIRLR